MFNEAMTNDRILKVTVTFERRQGGGLRAYSSDVPGLMLSGDDSEAVFEDVIPALETLCKHNLKLNVHFLPLVDVKNALQECGFLPPSDAISHLEYAATVHRQAI